MIKFYKKYKKTILNLSLKKIYSYFFLNDVKSTSYYYHLKNLIFDFLQSKYPDYNKENFEKKLNKLVVKIDDYKDLSSSLDSLFKPKLHDDLQFHYKYTENRILFQFILYSLNIKLIKKKYSDIYDFAIAKLNKPLDILEIGGGLPHGFIYNLFKKDKNFFNSFNYIDADLLHSEFVSWFCKKNKFNHQINLFPAAKVPKIENIKFNFVFAKDVFEHLDKPEILVDDLIINVTDEKTLLCLDLEAKSPHNKQHISPNLPILKEKLVNNNFRVIKEFGDIHIWEKK